MVESPVSERLYPFEVLRVLRRDNGENLETQPHPDVLAKLNIIKTKMISVYSV